MSGAGGMAWQGMAWCGVGSDRMGWDGMVWYVLSIDLAKPNSTNSSLINHF